MDLLRDRRRALYTVLRNYLHGDDLWSALVQWEERYAHQPIFPWKFLSELLTTPELVAQRAELRRALVHILSVPVESLDADPLPEMRAFRNRAPQGGGSGGDPLPIPSPAPVAWDGNGDGPAIACAYLVTQLLASLGERPRADLRRYVVHEVTKSRIGKTSRSKLLEWLSGIQGAGLGGIPKDELRSFLSIVYMGLCDAVGPSAADSRLGAAVARLKEDAPELARVGTSLL